MDDIVGIRVSGLGHSYGKRSLHRLLLAERIHVSQQRLGMSLQRTFPMAHAQRSFTLGRSMNPIPYWANFYGKKLPFDQNEKLVMYGVVQVIAVYDLAIRLFFF